MHGGGTPVVKAKAAQRIRDMLADAIDPDRVLRETGRIAYSDIRELFDERGNFRPIKEWPDDIARAVSSVEVVKKNVAAGDGHIDDVLKIRLWSKTEKLQDLMKHLGLLKDSVSVSMPAMEAMMAKLVEGRKRAASSGR